MTRAFVAVSPPEAVLDAVADATSTLEPARTLESAGVRRTTRDQWHVTLQFLGNAADIDAVGDALAGLPVGASTVRLGGAGAFPRDRRGRVLWIGTREGAEFLDVLAREVGARLAPIGHTPESRSFHPHLTLARAKEPTDFSGAIASLGIREAGPAWTVSEIVVFESRLSRDGARYLPRRTVTLRS